MSFCAPDCPAKPARAVFDRGWYLHYYADARPWCVEQPLKRR